MPHCDLTEKDRRRSNLRMEVELQKDEIKKVYVNVTWMDQRILKRFIVGGG